MQYPLCQTCRGRGGSSQGSSLSGTRLLTGSDFCFLWQGMDLFECLFIFKKKKKKRQKKKANFSDQSHVIPKQIPPASAHAALFQNLQAIFLHDCFSAFVWIH